MIEIKNKRIILYPTDRLIGAEGDIKTAKKVFILDKEEQGCDLSSLIAWIKLNPKGSGDNAYNQKLRKEIVGDKIKLIWSLTGANLKNAGELEAQIIMASPDYFDPKDLETLSDDSPILPSTISGVSAPVWQSYKETFVVADSIDDTISYSEINKNVLIAAVADASASAETAMSAAETVSEGLNQINEKVLRAEECRASAEESSQTAENAASKTAEHLEKCEFSVEQSAKYAVEAQNHFFEVDSLYAMIKDYVNKVVKGTNYRKIFSKTISAGESITSFNINRDENGRPFKLNAFVIYAMIPPTSDIVGYLKIDANNAETSYNTMCQFIGTSQTESIYTRIECKNFGRWVSKLVSAKSWFGNSGSANVSSPICSQSRVVDGKGATEIKFYQRADPKPFPEGTEIEIWGLDYIEAEE